MLCILIVYAGQECAVYFELSYLTNYDVYCHLSCILIFHTGVNWGKYSHLTYWTVLAFSSFILDRNVLCIIADFLHVSVCASGAILVRTSLSISNEIEVIKRDNQLSLSLTRGVLTACNRIWKLN